VTRLSALVEKNDSRIVQTDTYAIKPLLLPFGHTIQELRNVNYGDNFV